MGKTWTVVERGDGTFDLKFGKTLLRRFTERGAAERAKRAAIKRRAARRLAMA